jgi:hypothetical protein
VIVAFLDVGAGLPAQVHPGHPGLELHHQVGLGLRLRHAAELEHGGHVRPVLLADLRNGRRGVEVVAPVGHLQPALNQEGGVVRGVVQVLGDPEAEQVRGVEVGRVEDVDVGPERGAEVAAQRLAVGERGDRVERRLQRGDALSLDGDRIQKRGVVVPDLLAIGPGGRVGRRDLLEEIRGPAVGELAELVRRTPGAAVGRDLGLLEPGAVGVLPEAVARLNGGIHAGKVHAGGWPRSIGLGRKRRRDNQGKSERGETMHGCPIGETGNKEMMAALRKVGPRCVTPAPHQAISRRS